MPPVQKVIKVIGITASSLLVLAVIWMGLLITFSKPSPLEERLAELPPEERKTLDALLDSTGLALSAFRDVGNGAPMGDPKNLRSIAIERGHVRQLSLQGTGQKTLPSLSSWKELERLSLKGNALTALPDLSGCTKLRRLDASQNAITTLNAQCIPTSLQEIELSGNPLSDLSSLSHLLTAEKITVRNANITGFDALLDLPLLLLDLRDNPIATLPDRFPKAANFRVDLEGCPVFTPPGYLKEVNSQIPESAHVAQGQTTDGGVATGKFSIRGEWATVPQLATVSLTSSPSATNNSRGPVEIEVSVESGRLRIYLGEADETRGPWFQRGFVKGTDALFQRSATVYADATPAHPARLHGRLKQIDDKNLYFYVEPLAGDPVRKMEYHVWSD